jgi:hypothetical protein
MVATIQYTFGWHTVAAVQYTVTHKQYTQHTESNKHNNKKKNIVKCSPCLVFTSYILAFASKLSKKQGRTSIRVVEKCPDISVAVVQYKFSHKKYTEKHNETEHTKWDTFNNKSNYANKKNYLHSENSPLKLMGSCVSWLRSITSSQHSVTIPNSESCFTL